jgi:hypothetical protein
VKTAWQLNEKRGDIGLSGESLPFRGKRVVLQRNQEGPNLKPCSGVEVQDHFLLFLVDLNLARHAPHHSIRLEVG